MNLRRLETFYWAVKLGSFKSAAEKINSTQSTVSMRIQELERELGVVLFDRAKGAARPTDLGRELLPYVEKVLRSTAEMRDRISATGSISGLVRIGVAEVVSMTWLPLFVSEMRHRFPKVQIEIEEALTRELETRLDAGSLDVVLAPGGDRNSRHVTRPLGSVEFAWMASPSLCNPGHPLAPADLVELPVITLSEESFHAVTIAEWFGSVGSPDYVGICKSMGVAGSLAMMGLGITLLPVQCFTDALAEGKLIRVQTTPAFPIIPFRALASRTNVSRLPETVANIAAELSTFTDAPDMPPHSGAA
ncbi:LysR family transcriptional regulator [Paracoccus onubensis]|uniref:LysR family transcriptional regulator n=1 Tax=Paracoccus onubensis TaxID=1675788 RepID=A0A418STZ3_9RHOB|nr:LysR family transcriptional regulator [Paracoccus onubensis]RJE84453.1 LysR family transcriptional regulator [Paracoccus onubensis]